MVNKFYWIALQLDYQAILILGEEMREQAFWVISVLFWFSPLLFAHIKNAPSNCLQNKSLDFLYSNLFSKRKHATEKNYFF
jgi:hypothetical protein